MVHTTREIRKYFQISENENTTYQYLWDAAKAVLREKFIIVSEAEKSTSRRKPAIQISIENN